MGSGLQEERPRAHRGGIGGNILSNRGGIKLERTNFGQRSRCYFIAEIGANHEGDFSRAIDLATLAADAGADAVKFQNIRADRLGSRRGFDRLYREFGNKSQHAVHALEAYKAVEIPVTWIKDMRQVCDELGIDLITAPYYLEDIDNLAPYVDAFKVGSGDFSWVEKNLALLRTGKHLILATGMESLSGVAKVMSELEAHHDGLTLLQCNSNYSGEPGNLASLNLKVIQTFRSLWPRAQVGLSDHTKSVAVVTAAVALGASLVERHFADDGGRPGPDHRIALDFNAWSEMVRLVRETEQALGSPVKVCESNETYSAMTQRRALRASRSLTPGQVLSRQDITVLRPWLPGSLGPADIGLAVGSVVATPVSAGDEIRAEFLQRKD